MNELGKDKNTVRKKNEEEDIKWLKELGPNCELEIVKWEHAMSENHINFGQPEHYHYHNLWLEIDKTESLKTFSSKVLYVGTVVLLELVNTKYLTNSLVKYMPSIWD